MISVTVLTYNSEETIESCLRALSSFGEVILLDTGSKDSTIAIAQKFPNVRIFFNEFIGFGPLHNIATSYASHDWILSIDADEVMTEESIAEIKKLELNERVVYAVLFRNYLNGKWVRFSGWYPEHKLRLYNKTVTKFTSDFVHETIETKGLKVVYLKKPVSHFSYRKVSHFLVKMEKYSELFSEQNRGKRKSSLAKAIGKSWAAFFRCYILKRGFLDGKEGYIIARYQADVAYYKYLKLDEKNLSLHL
ncbi:MAG: glycosyltransferase family 2 protein [Chlamydiae bacterium]|nr:glycosyltransferase family 2 protein [Chlamydiota bacterium]